MRSMKSTQAPGRMEFHLTGLREMGTHAPLERPMMDEPLR